MPHIITTLRYAALSFVILLCIVPSLSAQTPAPTASKIDEFGSIEYSDLIARLDQFAVELQNEPTSSGYIFVYRDRRDLAGYSYRYGLLAKDYLVYTRGIDKSRVVLDGGIRDCRLTQLWIVPNGTPLPKPEGQFLYSAYDSDGAYIFDLQTYALPTDLVDGGHTDYPSPNSVAGRKRASEAAHLAAYAQKLRQKPDARAVLIAYAGYYIERGFNEYTDEGEGRRPYRKVISDPPATARRFLAAEKQRLITAHRIPASRIITIDGGYRAQRAVELWVVPRGEAIPLATPTVRPLLRKK